MRPNFNNAPQSMMRNSYGFQPVQFGLNYQLTKQNENASQQQSQKTKDYGILIKNLQSKIQSIQSLARKKNNQQALKQAYLQVNSQDKLQNNQNLSKKQYKGLPSSMKGIDLRGSCPTTIAKQPVRSIYGTSNNPPKLEQQNKNIKKFQPYKLQSNKKSQIEPQKHQIKQTYIPKSTVLQKQVNKQTQNKNNNIKIIQGFQLMKVLGKGKFGQVYLSKHIQTGFLFALKRIEKAKVIQYKMYEQLKNELKIHSALNHPNIVKFFGVLQQPKDIYIIIEYMNGGTLFDHLNDKDHLNEKQTVQFLRDIISAIGYLHDRSIAHRDLKPENIVLSSEGVAKVCDFGWAAIIETTRKTYCGTFDYAPPEILQRKNYDESVDIWCIGILTYQLLSGRVPFEGQKRNIVMNKIINVDKNKLEYSTDISEDAKNFIECLVKKDPEQRPKCRDLFKHDLFVNNPPPKNKKTI